jgi:hypothetical protein
MTIRIILAIVTTASVGGCMAESVDMVEDGFCRAGGTKRGAPAYVQCRAQLDADAEDRKRANLKRAEELKP